MCIICTYMSVAWYGWEIQGSYGLEIIFFQGSQDESSGAGAV